jgi:cytochrome c-type biogenesis protein CcmH
VTVSVSGGDGINPGDTVFILARNAQSQSRMPIAVQRMQGAQLPLTLRLDDSNSMAGQKLSETESVMVVVQVSPSGQPGDANATWTGQAGPLAPSLDGEAIAITLQPRG